MEKNVKGDSVYYDIAWSPISEYDKYRALGIPEMPGIVCLMARESVDLYEYLLFYSCWRSGIRKGLKDITDVNYRRFPGIIKHIEDKNLYYKYTVVDSNVKDLNDIMYWLIKEYEPLYNSPDFIDSQRYRDIYMKEIELGETAVVEKIKKIRS